MFIKIMPKILRMAEGDAGAGAAAGAGAGTPWYAGFDDETKGYMTNRGYDKKKPEEAFLEASKAHREATQKLGAPANELLRIPKDPNAAEWKDVWARLGKPGEAKDYDLSTVKRAGDKPIDNALADTLRNAAFDVNLPKEAAARLAAAVVKHLDAQNTATAAEKQDKLNTEKADLKKNWGNNEAANKVIAAAAARALGVDPATVEALEGVVGYAKIMEMFRVVGTKIGEDRFVNGGQGPNMGPMTVEQAKAEKEALMADKAWRDRYLAKGAEEVRKFTALNRIISGV